MKNIYLGGMRGIGILACAFLAVSNIAGAADKQTKTSTKTSVRTAPRVLNTKIKIPSRMSTRTRKSARAKKIVRVRRVSGVSVKTGSRQANRQLGHLNQVGKQAGAARAARNMKNLQELEKASKGRVGEVLGQRRSSHDPAGGTALGGHTVGHNNPPGNRTQQAGFNARDCMTDRSKCMSSSGSQHRGGITPAPTAKPTRMTKGNKRGFAADDSASETVTNADGSSTQTSSVMQDDGTAQTRVTIRDSGGKVVHESVDTVRPDGSTSTKIFTRNPDGSTRTIRRSSGGHAGMPREDGGSSSHGGGCNYNPVWHRCMGSVTTEQERRAKKKKGIGVNVRPGMGEQAGNGSSGNAVNIRLRKDVVTNTGSGNYNTTRVGRASGAGGKLTPCVVAQGGKCGNPMDPTAGPGAPARVNR